MKKNILLSLFCLFTLYSFAQSKKNRDSLHLVMVELLSTKKTFSTDTSLIKVYCELGSEYTALKNDSAIYYLNKSILVAERVNYAQGLLKANILMGRYYFMQFWPARSIEYWFKALIIAEGLNLPEQIKYLYGRIASCYMIIENYKEALTYFQKYTDLCKALGITEEYLMSLNSMGVLYFNKKDYINAMHYYNLCDSLNYMLQSPKAQTAALINKGKMQVELKNYDAALANFNKAINIEDEYHDRLAFVNNEIARVYLLKNKPQEALRYAKKAFANVVKTNAEMTGELAKTFSDIYEKLGMVDLAYKFYRDYAEIRLSEDSTKNSRLHRLVQLDYDNEKSMIRIANLSADLETKQANAKLMVGGLFSLLIVIAVIAIYSQSVANKNKLIEKQKTEIQKLNESLENKVTERTIELTKANQELIRKNQEISEALLKGQTMERERVASELHDSIAGTISALKWRFETLDRDKLSVKEQEVYDGILSNLHKAYVEVRLFSHNMLPTEFGEKGLIGALDRLFGDMNVSSSQTGFALDTAQLYTNVRQDVAFEIYTCCFETINNIMKHAKATKVLLSVKETANGDLEVIIEDNGEGFDTKLANRGKGLKNIASRVSRINGKQEVSSEKDKGSKLTITVPATFWEA